MAEVSRMMTTDEFFVDGDNPWGVAKVRKLRPTKPVARKARRPAWVCQATPLTGGKTYRLASFRIDENTNSETAYNQALDLKIAHERVYNEVVFIMYTGG